MAQLIIGHTTDTTARIWVRGDKSFDCTLTIDPAPERGAPVARLDLCRRGEGG